MPKSKMSCFKIMGCGGGDGGATDEEVDKEDQLALDENTTSSDKRRWSFRKRSTRHRVLSNTVISEQVAVNCNQESRQSIADNFQSPKYSSCTEKTSIHEKTDEISLPHSTITKDEVDPSVVNSKTSIDESDVVVIQTRIRGYLARKEYKRTKSAVKLQGAVRGYLVRRKAVGTLRCVQAIIKIQALVRARYAQQSVQEFSGLEGQKKSGKESLNVLSPSEKLLSHGFARKLLVSASSTKPICIKCQPSKADSAWKWMERWTAAIPLNFNQQNEKDQPKENELEHRECTMLVDLNAENEFISESNFTDKSETFAKDTGNISMAENISSPENQEPETNLENSLNSSPNYDARKCPMQDEVAAVIDKNDEPEIAKEKAIQPQLESCHLQSDPCLKQTSDSFSDKPYSISKHSTSQESGETSADDGKPPVFSLKSRNPAFAAVKSKFEELSSSSTVSKSNTYQDAPSRQRFDNPKHQVDSLYVTKEASATVNSVSYDSGVQVAASECGTEISISSTLDSPDRSEADGGEIVLEIGALEKENCVISSTSDEAIKIINMDTEGKTSRTDLDSVVPNEHEKSDGHLVSFISNEKEHSAEVLVESVTSFVPSITSRETATNEKVKSPEGTPRSQAVVTELHGTPSSEISLDTNTSKIDAGVSNKKQKKQITARNSTSSPNKGSGERTNIEQLSNEAKHVKRRHSFGISKPDQVDKELRTTNTSSLPSYMQATASARAKAHSTTSPKLSPDVQENQTRKRHSLPIENGKQSSSPRMERSASQAQQKTNGTHSPQIPTERRWQR